MEKTSNGSLGKVPEFTIRGGNELFKHSHYSATQAIFTGFGFNNNGYGYHIVQQSVIRKNDERIGVIVLKNSNEDKLSKMVFGKECSNDIIADNKVWYRSPYITSGFTKSLNLLDNDDKELLYFIDLLNKKNNSEFQTFDDHTTRDVSNFVDVLINNKGK